jgi:hypothetical protein
MLLTGNPMGAAYIAQGGLSFGKGNGFQIASQLLGFAAAASGDTAGDTSGGLFSLGPFGACKSGDDYCGTKPAVMTFPIPIGTGSGLGEFFIRDKRVGPFKGDNRNFDPAPNPSQSRAFFNLDFDKGIGTFQINPTCIAAGSIDVCKSALPIGDAGNVVNYSVSGNTVTLSGELKNSWLGAVPSALDVNVSFKISVTTIPGGIPTVQGSIDQFPSFEFTATVGGVTHVGPRFYETRATCLSLCAQRTFP